MQCPTESCHSRTLQLDATAEATVFLNTYGAVDHIEYGDWFITDDSAVSCDVCHWTGSYRDCAEAGDNLPLVERPGLPTIPPPTDPHIDRLMDILEGQAALVVAVRDIPEQYLDILVRLCHMETMLHVLTNAGLTQKAGAGEQHAP